MPLKDTPSVNHFQPGPTFLFHLLPIVHSNFESIHGLSHSSHQSPCGLIWKHPYRHKEESFANPLGASQSNQVDNWINHHQVIKGAVWQVINQCSWHSTVTTVYDNNVIFEDKNARFASLLHLVIFGFQYGAPKSKDDINSSVASMQKRMVDIV
jgi:hypothetical protein